MPIRPRSLPRRRTSLWRNWTLWIWFLIAFLFSVGGVCLWRSGRWLVKEDQFQKVPWALVLAGESRDLERSDAAIKLFKEGRIDTIILSTCRVFKTHYASEYLVDYYAKEGVPRGNVFEFRQDAYSTLEEARMLVRQFRYQNLDTVLIITANHHTARARRIFRKLAQGYPQILVYSADYHIYDPNAWWSNRESMKLWFDEWAKTIFTFFELARTQPETGKAEFQNLIPDIWSTQNRAAASAQVTQPPAPTVTDTLPKESLKPDSAVHAADTTKHSADTAKDANKSPGKEPAKESLKAPAKEVRQTGIGPNGSGIKPEAMEADSAANPSTEAAHAKTDTSKAKDSTAAKKTAAKAGPKHATTKSDSTPLKSPAHATTAPKTEAKVEKGKTKKKGH